jgi:hypothetical protein
MFDVTGNCLVSDRYIVPLKLWLVSCKYLITNEQTNWLHGGKVLLERLILRQLVKNIPNFFKFIIVFTRALHLSVSWATWTYCTSLYPISVRCILILSSHLRLGLHRDSCFKCSHEILLCISDLSNAWYMSCSSHIPWLDHANDISLGISIIKLIINCLRSAVIFSSFQVQLFSSASFLKYRQSCHNAVVFQVWGMSPWRWKVGWGHYIYESIVAKLDGLCCPKYRSIGNISTKLYW